MLVVLANDLPPAVRGRMKLWFIEPRPNVFISGISDAVAQEVVNYLHKHCDASSGLLIVRATPKAPGMRWTVMGPTRKPVVDVSGLQLVVETLQQEKPR